METIGARRADGKAKVDLRVRADGCRHIGLL
jgi:hypothetical protein